MMLGQVIPRDVAVVPMPNGRRVRTGDGVLIRGTRYVFLRLGFNNIIQLPAGGGVFAVAGQMQVDPSCAPAVGQWEQHPGDVLSDAGYVLSLSADHTPVRRGDRVYLLRSGDPLVVLGVDRADSGTGPTRAEVVREAYLPSVEQSVLVSTDLLIHQPNYGLSRARERPTEPSVAPPVPPAPPCPDLKAWAETVHRHLGAPSQVHVVADYSGKRRCVVVELRAPGEPVQVIEGHGPGVLSAASTWYKLLCHRLGERQLR